MVRPFHNDQPDSTNNTFTVTHSAYLAGMQLDKELFQQERGLATSLKDLNVKFAEFLSTVISPTAIEPDEVLKGSRWQEVD